MDTYFLDYIENAFRKLFDKQVYAYNASEFNSDASPHEIWIYEVHFNDRHISKNEYIDKYNDGYDYSLFNSSRYPNNYHYSYCVEYGGDYFEPPSSDIVESKEHFQSLESVFNALIGHIVLETIGKYDEFVMGKEMEMDEEWESLRNSGLDKPVPLDHEWFKRDK